MRIKRQAKARKALEFFIRAFSFETPYKFLLEPDFLITIIKSGLQLRNALETLIANPGCKLFLTTCIKRELDMLSVTPGVRMGEWKGVIQMIENKSNNVQYIACKHPKTTKCSSHECIERIVSPYSGEEDVKKVIDGNTGHDGNAGNAGNDGHDDDKKRKKKKEKKSNPEKLICCAQNSNLRQLLHEVPAVPTVFIHSNTLVFEEPSEVTKEYATRFKVGHHQKVSSRQNLSILENLKRFAPEKNTVLDEAMEKGGVLGNIINSTSTVGSIVHREEKKLVTTPSVHGKKHKPLAANPLSKKKPLPKQMPSLSFKTQKKLQAEALKNAVSTQPNKKQNNGGKNNHNNNNGQRMVQLPKPTMSVPKMVKGGDNEPQNNKKRKLE
jgi:rRNA-processing protein FCF1